MYTFSTTFAYACVFSTCAALRYRLYLLAVTVSNHQVSPNDFGMRASVRLLSLASRNATYCAAAAPMELKPQPIGPKSWLVFRPHRMLTTHAVMRSIATDDPLARYISLSVMGLRCAKIAEWVEVLLVMETLEDQRHKVNIRMDYAIYASVLAHYRCIKYSNPKYIPSTK